MSLPGSAKNRRSIIVSTIQEFENTENAKRLKDGERSSTIRRSSVTRERNAGLDLTLLIDDSTNLESAFEHSIRLAKTYGARIVLMYITKHNTIPSGYADYARAERIRDFAPAYFESLAENTIARLRKRIEEEGVECASHTYLGSLDEALKSCQQNARVLMVVLPLRRRQPRNFLHRISLKQGKNWNLNTPVLLIPA